MNHGQQHMTDHHEDLFNLLCLAEEEVEQCNRQNGWYDADRTVGDEVALLHSEVSEMLEAYRKQGDIGSECADVFIRLLDFTRRHEIDLATEYRRKMDHNWQRSYRHGGRLL